MINKPTISLCVLAYNRPKDLEITIKSFLWQKYKNSEMLIIDDASPKNLETIARKWIKKNKRIRYIRNKRNLGLAANFNQSFSLCKGKYVLFLGDDDVFMSQEALGKYVSIFKNYSVGVVRARQIIFRNFKVFQAANIDNHGKEKIFNKGLESFENFLMDAASIAGLAFLNNHTLKTFLNTYETMYPQFELAAKMCLHYKTAQINSYLIGIGSSESQLNVMSYSLRGVKTNILDDLVTIYDRVKLLADRKNIKIFHREIFIKKMMSFLPLFIPYNTLKNGKKDSLSFVSKMYAYYKRIIYNPIFICSVVSIFSPIIFLRVFLLVINKFKLRGVLSKEEIEYMNSKLNYLTDFSIHSNIL